MMRIALLRNSPFGTLSGHDRALLSFVDMLKAETATAVEAFSIGKNKKRASSAGLGFYEHIVRGGLLAKRHLLAELSRFRPDVIVLFDRQLAGTVINYNRSAMPKAKVVVITDSPEVVYNFSMKIDDSDMPEAVKKIVKAVYIMHARRLYIKTVEAATHVILPTEEDMKRLIKEMPEAKDKCYVLQAVPTPTTKKARTVSNVSRVLFVGSYDYPPNKEAVGIIENSIAPKLPRIKFYIIGRGLPKKSHDNFFCLGELNNADLEDWLKRADLCIAPLMHGTGLKTKVLDYAAYGKPIVGTSIAFQGFRARNGFNAIVEDNPEMFAKRIEELSNNKKLLRTLQKNVRLLLNDFSREKVHRRFMALYKSLSQ
ncbi:MAG: glycosyltransferase family 4 protein [Candidatus Micrarchaeaceae archaeon]